MNELFPYQVEGAAWLAKKRLALLADEMGLGKSAQAIRAADEIGAHRVCVLCPAVARTNWHREFEKFAKLPRTFDIVFSRSHPPNLSDSVICSYDLAVHFEPGHFGRFDLLLLDEEHYLKSIKTKRTQRVFGKEGYVRHAKKIWALSGTPAPNHAGELWPLLYTFGVVSEPYERFLENYCTLVNGPYGQQVTGTRTDKIPELKRTLDRIMLRRKTDDVLKDLPKLFIQNLTIEPDDNQIGLDLNDPVFQKERETLERVFGRSDMSPEDALSILEGLAGSLSTLRRYTGLRKVSAIADLVRDELSNNAYDKIVIFAIHTRVISELDNRLKEFMPVCLTGTTDPNQRQTNIDWFQKEPRCRIFIGNIQAAGTAITLTAANQVLFVEQDWVPGNNAQAAKRCHRIGQSKPVFVRMAGLAGSFDEQVASILARKTRELFQLFDKNSLQIFPDLNNVTNSNENS